MSDQNSPVGLSRILVGNGFLTDAESKQCIQGMESSKGTYLQEVTKLKKKSYLDIAEFIADKFRHNLIDISSWSLEYVPINIDKKIIQQTKILPIFFRGKKLTVAVSDPSQQQAIQSIQFSSGAQIEVVIAEEDKLLAAIESLNKGDVKEFSKSMSSSEYDFGDEGNAEEEDESEDSGGEDLEDAPVVKFIQKILLEAINDGASDIHFEPYEKFYRIRYRVDGILREVAQPPLAIKEKLASRIKVISRLNIAEKRVPQDGRMRLVLSKSKAIDFRVSILPTLQGEKMVLRILDPSSATLGIEALGYEPEQKATLLDAVSRPYGMVLVTGPTGSGKTVSLYTCLNILNNDSINISTAEDPAEINLPGINQVNVDDRAGLTFSAALKAFLRQDPDVIMVGEIRDLETAEISVKAAQTGHLVLSTLHTNDAPQTLTRLANMGIPLFNIASSIHLITAQRLARKLCNCKVEIDSPIQALINAGFKEEQIEGYKNNTWKLYGPGQCDRCKNSGYKGRVGIYQVMPISEEIQKIILSGGTSLDIAKQAESEGVNDLRRSGILKVMQGMTSLDEVLSTTNL